MKPHLAIDGWAPSDRREPMSVSRGGSRRIRQNQPKLRLNARGLAVQSRLIVRKTIQSR